jgi:DNA-binding XRE family transcriptional regulator
MRPEASASDIELGILEPMRSTAEIIDFMGVVHSHKPKATKKKPSTPLEEVWAQEGYVISDAECSEWVTKADYGMFVHGDRHVFFTTRGDEIVRVVRHAKNHHAPTVARKYTLKITADENSSPEQKAAEGAYTVYRPNAEHITEPKGVRENENQSIPIQYSYSKMDELHHELMQLSKSEIIERVVEIYDARSPLIKDIEIRNFLERSERLGHNVLVEMLMNLEIDRLLLITKNKRRVKEGVTKGRSDPMSEKDKDRQIGGKFNVAADDKKVGDVYTAIREGAGLTKVELAEQLDVSEGSVRQLEKGRSSPSLKTLKKYADALGYEVRIELVPTDKS